MKSVFEFIVFSIIAPLAAFVFTFAVAMFFLQGAGLAAGVIELAVYGICFFISLVLVIILIIKSGKSRGFAVSVIIFSFLLGASLIVAPFFRDFISRLFEERQIREETRQMYGDKIVSDAPDQEVVCYLNNAKDTEYVNEEFGYRITLPAGWRWKGVPLSVGCDDTTGGRYYVGSVMTPILQKDDLLIVFEDVEETPGELWTIDDVEYSLQGLPGDPRCEGSWSENCMSTEYKKVENVLNIPLRNDLLVAVFPKHPMVYIENAKSDIFLRVLLINDARGAVGDAFDFNKVYFEHEQDFLEGLSGFSLIP